MRADKIRHKSFPFVASLHPKTAFDEAHASLGDEIYSVDADVAAPAVILQAGATHVLIVEPDDSLFKTLSPSIHFPSFMRFAFKWQGAIPIVVI